jgi:hypothetical protein
MQRRRSIPHTFEDRIAAEKARLEAQVAKLNLVLKGRAAQEDKPAGYRRPYQRVADLSGASAAKARLAARPPRSAASCIFPRPEPSNYANIRR